MKTKHGLEDYKQQRDRFYQLAITYENDIAVWLHAWEHDSRPPQSVINRARKLTGRGPEEQLP